MKDELDTGWILATLFHNYCFIPHVPLPSRAIDALKGYIEHNMETGEFFGDPYGVALNDSAKDIIPIILQESEVKFSGGASSEVYDKYLRSTVRQMQYYSQPVKDFIADVLAEAKRAK